MSEAYAMKVQKAHTLVWLFLGMLIYKFAIDLSYLWSSRYSSYGYLLDFNPLKYLLSFFWCLLLFATIRHTAGKASSVFLYLIFLFQIVPISTVYALKNDNSIYYNVLCLSFFLCELIVGYTRDWPILRRNFPISRAMSLCYAAATMLLVVYIISKNGMPHLSLLNIYTVYEYRRSGAFQINKYVDYILNWATVVFIPFSMAKALADSRYKAAGLTMGSLLLIYLYTGYKSLLFAIPFIVVFSLWSKRKSFYQEVFLLGCGGYSILSILNYLTEPGSLWYYLYGLSGERLFILPAHNKFLYYDYFLTHPKQGFAGIFPRWFINIPNYYANLDYTHDISAIYYGYPDMGSNTGFFAEGYLRFGHIGTVLLLLLFALLLKQIDCLQDRAGYPFTIGTFIYPISLLTDIHLLDSLVFGPWMFLAMILLFYKPRPDHLPEIRNQTISTGLSIRRIGLFKRKRGVIRESSMR